MKDTSTFPASESMIFKKIKLPPIAIIGILFFIFGFVTWLNGVLIPFLKIACGLTTFQAYFVTFAFYISYLVMAPPSSYVLQRIGFKNGIALGLLIMAAGSLIFIPAAISRTFSIFLIGLFVQGAGLALLQTASNPYVTFLGPHESAARRIGIMGICNKVAGVISPLVLGAIVLQGGGELETQLNALAGAEHTALLDSLANRVILPYVIIAAILSGLAWLVRVAHLPEIRPEATGGNDKVVGGEMRLWHFPHLMLGFVAIFLYVGVEVMAGDTIVLYGQSQGISLDIASRFTSYTLAFMVVGYIIGIFTIPTYIRQHHALAVSAVLGTIFSIGAIFTSGYVSVTCIALLGLANAMMWPAIWPLAIADLGRFTKSGSALMVMGIAGGATIPLLYGYLADLWKNPQQAYWIMIPIYLYIGFFAVVGYKIRKQPAP